VTKHTVAKDKEMKKQIDEENQKRVAEGNKPLKKSKTKVPVTVTSKVTKRPHHKIMEKL
jgi:ABC-type Fe3+-citrate transport system substrate-binding protein